MAWGCQAESGPVHDGNRPELRPLDLSQEALPADAPYTRETVVLASFSGSADQFLGGEHGFPSAFRGHTKDRLSR